MSRRDTGFPDEVKALVLMRSDGRCEACGERTGDLQYHHRRARGMGRPGGRTPTRHRTVCWCVCWTTPRSNPTGPSRMTVVIWCGPCSHRSLSRCCTAANGCCWMTTATRIPCRLRLMGGRRDCRSVMRGVRPRSRLHPEIRIARSADTISPSLKGPQHERLRRSIRTAR